MEQNRTQLAKKQMLKALESSLGVVTTALKATDLSRTNYYKWLKEDEDFAQKVKDVDLIAKDFVKSKFYECIKDKVPSVVIHGAFEYFYGKPQQRVDVTSNEESVNIPLITFIDTDTE